MYLSNPTCVVGVTSIQRKEQETSEGEKKGSKSPITSSPWSRVHARPFVKDASTTTTKIRSPSQLPSLVEKAQTLAVDGQNSSFVARLELEETKRKELANPTRPMTHTSPLSFPVGNWILWFALMGCVVSGQASGLQAIREALLQSIGALAVVWIPACLLQGDWVELVSCAMLLITQPAVRTYVVQKWLPQSFATVKKFVMAEIWRRIWMELLAPFPRPRLVPSELDWENIKWLPTWVKQGFHYVQSKIDSFVQSTIKSSIQKTVHGSLGLYYDSISSSVIETTYFYQDSAMAEDKVLSSDNEGSSMVAELDEKVAVEESEPSNLEEQQVVCVDATETDNENAQEVVCTELEQDDEDNTDIYSELELDVDATGDSGELEA